MQTVAWSTASNAAARRFFCAFYRWNTSYCALCNVPTASRIASRRDGRHRDREFRRWNSSVSVHPPTSEASEQSEDNSRSSGAEHTPAVSDDSWEAIGSHLAIPAANDLKEAGENVSSDQTHQEDIVRRVTPAMATRPTVCDSIKDMMRHMTYPLAVVTSSRSLPSGRVYEGMTVSSMTTVSLKPQPVISFNIKMPSQTWNGMHQNGSFLIHLLCATPSAARIADIFTKGKAANAFDLLTQINGNFIDESSGVSAPSISGFGIKSRLVCSLLKDKTVTVGDHKVVFAQVVDYAYWHVGNRVWHQNPDLTVRQEWLRSLAYCDGQYRIPGHCINPAKDVAVGAGTLEQRKAAMQRLLAKKKGTKASDMGKLAASFFQDGLPTDHWLHGMGWGKSAPFKGSLKQFFEAALKEYNTSTADRQAPEGISEGHGAEDVPAGSTQQRNPPAALPISSLHRELREIEEGTEELKSEIDRREADASALDELQQALAVWERREGQLKFHVLQKSREPEQRSPTSSALSDQRSWNDRFSRPRGNVAEETRGDQVSSEVSKSWTENLPESRISQNFAQPASRKGGAGPKRRFVPQSTNAQYPGLDSDIRRAQAIQQYLDKQKLRPARPKRKKLLRKFMKGDGKTPLTKIVPTTLVRKIADIEPDEP